MFKELSIHFLLLFKYRIRLDVKLNYFCWLFKLDCQYISL